MNQPVSRAVQRLSQPLWLVAYDIAHPARWRRLYRLLCGQGMRIQYSVFLLPLSAEEIDRLVTQIRSILREDVDDVRIYYLPVGTRIWHDGPPMTSGIQLDIAGLGEFC